MTTADDPYPELLLFCSIVRHIRHLVWISAEDRNSFRRDVKTSRNGAVFLDASERRDGTS